MSAAVTKGISTKTTFSGVSSAATTGQTTTNASTIAVVLNWSDAQAFVSLTDNKGNADNIEQVRDEVVGNGHRSRAFVIKNIAGGTGHTFTATFSANTTGTIYVVETLTADLNAPVDVSFVPENDAVDPFDGSVTTTDANTHLIGFVGGDSSNAAETHTEANGFTRYEEEPDGSTRWAGAIFGIIKSATGTYTFSASDNGSSNAHVHLIAIKGANGPAFTAQPTNQTTAEGGTGGFSGTVQSSGGAVTHQWEMNDGQGAGWVNATGGSGTTTDNLTTPTAVRATHAGRLYRLKSTDNNGTTTSNVVEWSVTAIPATVSGDGMVVGESYVGEGMVGAPDLPAGNALDAAGTAQATGTAALTTGIPVAAAGVTVSTGSAALTTAIRLALSGQAQATGTGSLTTGIQLNAAGQAVATGGASMSTGIPLGAVGASAATGNGTLTTSITLSAAGLAQAIGTALLGTDIRLAAAGTAQATGNAAMTTQIILGAVGQALATGNATITVQIQLNGAGVAVATGSADLTTGGGNALAASGAAAAAGSAQLTTAIPLLGAGAALGTGTAALSTAIKIAAAGTAQATGSAALTSAIPLIAAGASAGNGNGTLTTSITLTAQGVAQALAAGGLTTVIQLSAAGVSNAVGTGQLTEYVFVPSPFERTVYLNPESRVAQRTAEIRALWLDAETRSHPLPPEHRLVALMAENRTLIRTAHG